MPGHILIADDSSSMRNLLNSLVNENDAFTVDFAEDGLSALKLIQNTMYGLIVIDNKMPGMDGIDVIRESSDYIRSLRMNVALISASIDAGIIEIVQTERLPVSVVISKPFTSDVFKDKIRHFLPKNTSKVDIISKINKLNTSIHRTVTDRKCRNISDGFLSINILLNEDYMELSLKGVANIYTAEVIKCAFKEILPILNRNLVLNIDGVTNYDESFIGLMLTVMGMAAERGNGIALISGDIVMAERLRSLKIDLVIAIFCSTAEYKKSLFSNVMPKV